MQITNQTKQKHTGRNTTSIQSKDFNFAMVPTKVSVMENTLFKAKDKREEKKRKQKIKSSIKKVEPKTLGKLVKTKT